MPRRSSFLPPPPPHPRGVSSLITHLRAPRSKSSVHLVHSIFNSPRAHSSLPTLLTSRVSVISLCPLPTKFPLFYFHSSICYHSRPPPLSPVRARPESRSFATLYIGYVNSSASASVLPSQLLRLLLSLLLRREPRP